MVTSKASFSDEERIQFDEKLNIFLTERNWSPRNANDVTEYVKAGAKPPSNFLEKPPKRLLPSAYELTSRIRTFFAARAYKEAVQNDVAYQGAIPDTFLVCAGVQYFRDCFWGEKPALIGSYFLPQPVIRMNQFNRIGQGISSSFVNLSTVQLNPTMDAHLTHIDTWFDLLSELGLYVGDFSIKRVPSNRYAFGKNGNWAKTAGISLTLNYGNLQVGDAGFIKVPAAQNQLLVSDVGFGLERILWAVCKTPYYFDMIGPKDVPRNIKISDSVRSAVLLRMSNISKEQKDAYHQYKKFIKRLAQEQGHFDLFKYVKHYYSFWSQFIKPSKDAVAVYDLISDDLVNCHG